MVTRDDVARAGCVTPDGLTGEVPGLPLGDHAAAVTDSPCAGGVGADEIALHQIPGRPRSEEDAGIVVARDDVACCGDRTSDPVVRTCDVQAAKGVPQVERPCRIQADIIPFDDVSSIAAQLDPIALESIDDQP